MEKEAPNTILVIFGISGDLSHRFLLPALEQIKKVRRLPKEFRVLGISRRDINYKEALGNHTAALQPITRLFQMNMSEALDYNRLKTVIKKMTGDFERKPQIIFYFAVPPAAVQPIIRHLGQANLNQANIKLLLEKPFGVDLESAQEVIAGSQKYFKDEQIYRIDHYLAKEMVQNIAVFLGSNVLFRDIWNQQFIEYIEIVAAEKIGIEGRVGFYEQAGALRDFVQNHLLQLAALTLMEPCPHDYDFADLPERRLAALKQFQPPPPDELAKKVFRAQYKGYRQEVGNPKSTTETFVALQLRSHDRRWQGVPIYLATGKNLDQKLTQIRINFKRSGASEANNLILRIQPREGVELDLWVKRPGYERDLQKKTLSFYYQQAFEDRLPDAYEQVLVEAIRSRRTLFASDDEVLASWQILQPILDRWSMSADDLYFYKPGSSADEILAVNNG